MADDNALAANAIVISNPEFDKFLKVVEENPDDPRFKDWVDSTFCKWHTIILPNWDGTRSELFALVQVPFEITTYKDPTQ